MTDGVNENQNDIMTKVEPHQSDDVLKTDITNGSCPHSDCHQSPDNEPSHILEVGPDGDASFSESNPDDDKIPNGVPDTSQPDELVSVYREFCTRHSVKPITSVLQQIQVMPVDSTGRCERLSIIDDRLDTAACDAIESILKRLQFKTIDIANNQLDDDSLTAFCDMVEYYESAERLNLAKHRNVTPRGWAAVARMLRKTLSLTRIDISECVVSENSYYILSRALRLGTHLSCLHLHNLNLRGRPLYALAVAIRDSRTLRELHLPHNSLVASDAQNLAGLLRVNRVLAVLDLRENHIQDAGMEYLCQALCEAGPDRCLASLNLRSNSLSYQSMPALAKAIILVPSLEVLDLGENNLTNEGLYRLKESLMKNRTLRRLSITDCRIGCEGAVALAEVIAENRALQTMDIRKNEVKTAGLMALSLALKVNQSITCLDVDRDTKKESAMKDYAEQQTRLLKEISGFLQRNILNNYSANANEEGDEGSDKTVDSGGAHCRDECEGYGEFGTGDGGAHSSSAKDGAELDESGVSLTTPDSIRTPDSTETESGSLESNASFGPRGDATTVSVENSAPSTGPTAAVSSLPPYSVRPRRLFQVRPVPDDKAATVSGGDRSTIDSVRAGASLISSTTVAVSPVSQPPGLSQSGGGGGGDGGGDGGGGGGEPVATYSLGRGLSGDDIGSLMLNERAEQLASVVLRLAVNESLVAGSPPSEDSRVVASDGDMSSSDSPPGD